MLARFPCVCDVIIAHLHPELPMLKALRFATLLLAALSLTMESAHVTRAPQKMRYDLPMYSAVNSTLYKWFAVVGGAYQVIALLLGHRSRLSRLRGRGESRSPAARAAQRCSSSPSSSRLAVVQPVNI